MKLHAKNKGEIGVCRDICLVYRFGSMGICLYIRYEKGDIMENNNLWWENTKEFGENLEYNPTFQRDWDAVFMEVAVAFSNMSKCSSRNLAAVLVKDRNIISVGINGSPHGSNMCQDKFKQCPRRKMGFESGQGIEYCPAQHAEENAVNNAAKNGVATKGATLYCNCGSPCQHCAGTIINAGIARIVFIKSEQPYDRMAAKLLKDAGIIVDEISGGQFPE